MEVNHKSLYKLNLLFYQSYILDISINGWYVRDFLGKTGHVDYRALKSGLNAVPLTITDGRR